MSASRFRLDGARVCLNLVATLGKRHAEPIERIPDAESGTAWLAAAGVLPTGAMDSMTNGQLDRLRRLREAVNELVRAAMASRPLPADALSAVNAAAMRPDLAPILRQPGLGAVAWQGSAVDAAISTIARDAVELLAHGRIDRIRECEGPDCSLLFYDDSQAGRRRWCSMNVCGAQSKVRNYRSRRRQA
ncbi:CGNR zinc finger domain-containing protein [Agromyces bauzanensis]|uniref:Zinc finger CGNR domain-containing protein n=1 Tax=Agromyces bauzanensis TaxID=1308924 RepID=A0A917UT22_9MICO|nr:ABATE domain-containing protein [Agromyces bauzanensis]GGJ83268.1 hypothetical protein GCM10011372_21980 [Agromyces bauzanensis]